MNKLKKFIIFLFIICSLLLSFFTGQEYSIQLIINLETLIKQQNTQICYLEKIVNKLEEEIELQKWIYKKKI